MTRKHIKFFLDDPNALTLEERRAIYDYVDKTFPEGGMVWLLYKGMEDQAVTGKPENEITVEWPPKKVDTTRKVEFDRIMSTVTFTRGERKRTYSKYRVSVSSLTRLERVLVGLRDRSVMEWSHLHSRVEILSMEARWHKLFAEKFAQARKYFPDADEHKLREEVSDALMERNLFPPKDWTP